MGVAGPLDRHQTDQLPFGHFPEHGRRQFFTDQDRVLRIDRVLLLTFLQVGQQTAAEIPDVDSPLLQVVVVHHFKVTNVLLNHLFQRALGPETFLDPVAHLTWHCVIAQHTQIDIEQSLLFRAKLGSEPGRHPLNIFPNRSYRAIKQRQFQFNIIGGLLRHYVQVGGRVHHHTLANGNARRTRHTTETDIGRFFTGQGKTADGARCLAVGDNAGQLSRNGNQEGFFTLVKAARTFPLLNNKNTKNPAMVNDRNTQERAETLFASLRKVTIAGVGWSIFKVDRLLPGANQTNQALGISQADLPYCLLVQAFRGHQYVAICGWVKQVNRANLGIHGFLHPRNNDIQRLLQIAGTVYLLYKTSQYAQHGGFNPSFLCVLRASGRLALAPLFHVIKQPRRELSQRTSIDLAFERDDLPKRVPVANPLPAVEFRRVRAVYAYLRIRRKHPQQEPFLFLSHADRVRIVAHHPAREAVSQPATGTADDFHIACTETNFLRQFPVKGLFR